MTRRLMTPEERKRELSNRVHIGSGETALVYRAEGRELKAQFNRLDHEHSHGWHPYDEKEFWPSKPLLDSDAEEFFSILFKGKHHIPSTLKPEGETGWSVTCSTLCSWDDDFLTRLVFLSHDMCVRSEVSGSRPPRVKISIFPREGRSGSWSKTHPSIEQALRAWRDTYSGSHSKGMEA